MESGEFVRCLELVLRARLQREGHIVMPVGDSSVETVTDLRRAVELTRCYLVPDTVVNPSDNSVN